MAPIESPKIPPTKARLQAGRGILLTQGVRLLFRIVTAAVLARLLLPADYGVFGMAALLHGVAYILQDFGLAAVTLRKPDLGTDERVALFWLNAAIGVGVGLAVAASGSLAALFFGEPLLRWLLPAMAVTFLINGLHSQLRAQLARELRFTELNRIEILAVGVSSGAAMLAAFRGAGPWALVLLPVTAEIVIGITVWFAQRWRPGRWPAGFSSRGLLRFGAGISSHEMLRYFQRNIDQVFVGRLFGSDALGLYGRSVQLITLPIQYALDPLAAWSVTSLAQAGKEDARSFWRRVLNGLAHLMLPPAVVLFCLPDETLRVAFGPNWVAGAGMLRGLSLVLVAQPVLASVVWLLIATGRTRRLIGFSSGMLAAVTLACALTLAGGPVAVARAFGGATLLVAFVLGFIALRGLPAGPADLIAALWRPLALALVAAAVTALALSCVPELNALGRLAGGSFLILATWTAGCVLPGVRLELTQHFLRHRR